MVTAAAIDSAPALCWWAWWLLATVAAVVALVAGGVPLAALVAGAAVGGPLIALRAARSRAPAKLEAALPGALEAVARSLRTGASLRQAVAEAAAVTPRPLGPELARVAAQAGHGAPMVGALEALAERRPLPGVRLAVAALCLSVETGGAQARAVDGVAATLRDRLAGAADIKALSAQARLSALVITLAPVAFGIFAAATDPRTAAFLFRTPAGLGLLAAGILLDGLGAFWMHRLARPPV